MAKKIYTTKLKMEIVRRYLTGDIGLSVLANEYQVTDNDIQKWVAAYQEHGIAGLCTTYGSYSGDFKLSVIEYIMSNNASIRKAAAHFNIASYTTIGKWKRIYEEYGKEALYEDRRGRGKKSKPTPIKTALKEPETHDTFLLLLEVKKLRMENEYLRKLNALIEEQRLSVSTKSEYQ